MNIYLDIDIGIVGAQCLEPELMMLAIAARLRTFVTEVGAEIQPFDHRSLQEARFDRKPDE